MTIHQIFDHQTCVRQHCAISTLPFQPIHSQEKINVQTASHLTLIKTLDYSHGPR